MSKRQIEARLYWGRELEAVAYTALGPGLRVCDLALPLTDDTPITDERADLVARVVGLENDLEIHLTIVEKERSLPRTIGDGRIPPAFLAAVALHAVVAALAYHGRASQAEEEERARAAMMSYAAAIDARSNEKIDPRAEPVNEKGGEPAAGKEGAAGNPARTNDVGRMKETRGADHRASRTENGSDVSTFGILTMIANDRPEGNAGSSPWAKDLGLAAMGNMFGATIDDAAGNGGLGLTGNGEGGGGKGKGVAFGGMDGIGFGSCGPGCVGGLRGGHAVRSPVLRCGDPKDPERGCTMQVNGRLLPEAIQRVVRASFGRFRGCYEDGLRRDPGLEGRVSTKFVIARDGSVAMVSLANASLPDASVVRCVERAFYNLTFPEPEGGIVTVEYPIVFSTSS